MKKYILFSVIVALLGGIAIFYFLRHRQEKYQLVTFSGAQQYMNLSKTSYAWIVGNNKDSVSALPLCHKDFVSVVFNSKSGDSESFAFPYFKSDGNYLVFRQQKQKLFVNDKMTALILEENEEIIDWLKNASDKELAYLRSIIIKDELSSDFVHLLGKIAHAQSTLAIFLQEEIKDIDEILQILDPTWLFISNCDFDAKTIERISILDNLELLSIDGNCKELNKLKLPKLSELVISDFYQPLTDEFIKSIEHISSFTIIGSDVKNVEFLKEFTGLQVLCLIDCDSLADVSSIQNLKNLQVVTLTDCDDLQKIDSIKQLPSLFWFSFPNNIGQNDFETFLSTRNDIEIIELCGCKNIQSIKPLQKLTSLACLHLYDMDVDINSLYELQDLQYLAISEDILADSTNVFDGEHEMPNTIIVPSLGVCLGSGWLLLFFPILMMAKMSQYLFKQIKKQR